MKRAIIGIAAALLVGVVADHACAQLVGNNGQLPFFPPQVTNNGQALTAQQQQQMMMMRAMQGRGRRGVQTGMPQFIFANPFGMVPGMGMPGMGGTNIPYSYYDDVAVDDDEAGKKLANRKALEEKRQAEKEEKERKAKAKKDKNRGFIDDGNW